MKTNISYDKLSTSINNEEKTNVIDQAEYSVNSKIGINRLISGFIPGNYEFNVLAIIAFGTLPLPAFQATILLTFGFVFSCSYDFYMTKNGFCPYW